MNVRPYVQNIDYAPTYLDIAGIEKPDYMVGTSLVPLFGGETPRDWREYLYYHYYDYPSIHMVRRHDGVRDSRYKLIHSMERRMNIMTRLTAMSFTICKVIRMS